MLASIKLTLSHSSHETNLEVVLEPVSSTLPKVSSKAKYDVIEYLRNSSVSLLCPAQGFPAPNFR